jgi:hypothetical protein
MGTEADRAIRAQQHRQDDDARKAKIKEARRIIYEEHLSVNTNRVEELLKPTSLVPTNVSHDFLLEEVKVNYRTAML